MAESSLSLGYPDIAAEVGEFIGAGRTSDNWTTAQLAHVNAAMDSGMRKFLRPLDQRTGRLHEWSFTRLTATLTMVADTQSYDLADDFGGPRGPFTYPADEGRAPIHVTSEGEIRSMQAVSDLSDYPYMVAIVPKSGFDGTSGSRWQAKFFPTPSAAVVITYPYYVLMETRLRSGTPYPLGGMAHSETLKAACMASAELQRKTEVGVWAAEYQVLLQTSIEYDKKENPDNLGKNLDGPQGYRGRGNYYVTLNGSIPT